MSTTLIAIDAAEPVATARGIQVALAKSTTVNATSDWLPGFFRAADGVKLQKLCLCGITAHPPKKAITKTALGAEETVPWEHNWDAVHMAEALRRDGFEIAAIETKPEGIDGGTDSGVDLYDWQPSFPVCVMFGHEVDGLRPELLTMADSHVRITQVSPRIRIRAIGDQGPIQIVDRLAQIVLLTRDQADQLQGAGMVRVGADHALGILLGQVIITLGMSASCLFKNSWRVHGESLCMSAKHVCKRAFPLLRFS